MSVKVTGARAVQVEGVKVWNKAVNGSTGAVTSSDITTLDTSGTAKGSLSLNTVLADAKAFNDNAAITYLATLVPGFTDNLKHAVVAGAVAGGGLTVIANAPNPAGMAILARYFGEGIAPLKLALGALLPTAIVAVCLMLGT